MINYLFVVRTIKIKQLSKIIKILKIALKEVANSSATKKCLAIIFVKVFVTIIKFQMKTLLVMIILNALKSVIDQEIVVISVIYSASNVNMASMTVIEKCAK